MKKCIATIIIIFACIFTINAQNVKYGVKAGLNFSNLEIKLSDDFEEDDSEDINGKTGFYFGGFVDISISEKFSIQPELLFSIEGGEDTGINFVNVPIMAKYYITSGLSLQAGPQIGFLVSAEDDADEFLKSTNFGLNAGLGFDLKETGIFFDARYNFGLSDIGDATGFEVNTKGFQIGVGYKF
ncbi:porin family protein [Kordia jejudonensis]|uniref:porin family protein n=1 Tax=Kordia jejudonensis TaxID=1348245 RepID=UPI0006294EDF|nr:porin family protein [Kordia jejudonensis]